MQETEKQGFEPGKSASPLPFKRRGLRRTPSVNLWEIDEGATNPLSSLPEARAFQEGLKTWMAEPPIYEQLTVIGSYRFF